MKEANLIIFIINLCVAVLVGALLPLLPALTRKSFLFGVKIPIEEHGSPEAKSIRKQYITVCLTGAVVILALVIAQYFAVPNLTIVGALYFPLFFVVVEMAGFIPGWRKASKLKEARGWKLSDSVFADTKSSQSRGNLSELPWIWYIVSLAAIFASVVITLVKYPGLPDRIPTHYDINMQPDAWADKSLLSVMLMPLICIVMLIIIWLTGFMLVRAKRQIDSQNPELSFAQHRIYRKRMGHGAGFLALGLTIGFVLLGFMSIFPELNIPFSLLMTIMMAPCVPLVVISVACGQGGCKIKPKSIGGKPEIKPYDPEAPVGVSGRGDDKYWALGLFYHNRNDPAYLVEDRFGTNLGFNYSRLPVKIGVVVSALLFIAMYVWITVMLWQVF